MNTGQRIKVVGLLTKVPTTQGEKPYINFDNAASTPPLLEVMQVVNKYMPWYSSVHRGSGLKSRLSTELYEQARHVVSNFVNASPDEYVVIFVKNTTEAINKLSYRLNLSKKDIVLISHLEHHSNDLPWRATATVKRIAITDEGDIDKNNFIHLLQKYKNRVKLVAISGASNVTGHIPDIHWFARKAHEIGAQIMIDAAQLAAHRPISMEGLSNPEHLDYIAISGHKMYAPFGSGALIGRKDRFTFGKPEYRGGGTVNFVTPKLVDWAPPPDSDEAGTPNVVGAIALAQAVQTLTTLDLPAIAKHESKITVYALDQLRIIPGLKIFGSSGHALHRSGIITFTLQNAPPHLVSAILGYEWGIGVRSGCFCAHPYVMSLLGVNQREQKRIRNNLLRNRRDTMPGMVRVSFGLYNTLEEVDRLVEALQAISRGKYGKYELDSSTGLYSPVGVTQDLLKYLNVLS